MRFLLFFLFLSPHVLADGEPVLSGQQWLIKVDLAMQKLSYHGTVVFFKNSHLDAMIYQHGFEDGNEVERLTSLNSPLREVVRKSSDLLQINANPSKATGRHPYDRSFILNLPRDIGKLENQYLLAVADQEIIASRLTQIIAVLPKDDMRYARKIWVDRETFLPLRVEVYSPQGVMHEEVLFTELKLDNSIDSARFMAEEAATAIQNLHAKNLDEFEQSPYRIKNLPSGFELSFFVPNSIGRSKKTVDHLLVSDGFSNVSIYIEGKGKQSTNGMRSLGALNSFSKIIGTYQVTVLGEVPAKTVELIASAVTLR
jgi:sigma-E factor negative regulatory protein RseB